MSKTIKAIYENGVFKPIPPVDIQEHLWVSLTIEDTKSVALSTSGIIPDRNAQTVDEIAIAPEFMFEET
ncbi:MAG: antitoxin family protein [Thermodesulfovibrionales bacterium]|jgi:predicted DNA-binding antitoxin AbrB/MazE fold protein